MVLSKEGFFGLAHIAVNHGQIAPKKQKNTEQNKSWQGKRQTHEHQNSDENTRRHIREYTRHEKGLRKRLNQNFSTHWWR
jgi:hypothetical protein